GEELYEASKSKPSGFRVAMKTFDSTRPIVASMAIGIARAAYEYTLDIVKAEYPKSGRYFYSASETLAMLKQNIRAARLLTWEAAMCKAYAGEMALEVCEKCLELLGPIGLDGHVVEKWYRDVKVFDIFEGTNQVQHLVTARRQYAPYGIRV